MSNVLSVRDLNPGDSLPPAVVLGAGTSLRGLTPQSTWNSVAAAALIDLEVLPSLCVFSGRCPTGLKDSVIPQTEARGMAEVAISILKPLNKEIEPIIEETSTSTIENLKNVAPLIEQFGLDGVTIIAGHARRATDLARVLLPAQTEIVAIDTAEWSNTAQFKEFLLRGVVAAMTHGIKDGDAEAFKYRSEVYNSATAKIKGILGMDVMGKVPILRDVRGSYGASS